jgi:hypothetical protein
MCDKERSWLRRRTVLGIFVLLLTFLFIPNMIVSASTSEPSLMVIFDHLGFNNVVVTDVETFPAGLYEITLYAEFAGYCDENELSYYNLTNVSELSVIFEGPEGGFTYLDPPITKMVNFDSQFGLSMLTPEDHRYFTENSRNPDGQNHSVIYENLDDPTMYLIGFENLYGLGDRDYQDLVFSLKPYIPRHVVPEIPFGVIAGLLTMLAALISFAGFKRFHFKK